MAQLKCRLPPAAPRGNVIYRAPARLPRSASDPRTRSVLFRPHDTIRFLSTHPPALAPSHSPSPSSSPPPSRLAIKKSVELVQTNSPRSDSDPRRDTPFDKAKFFFEKKKKKVETRLDFPISWCKLIFGTGLQVIGNGFQAHFIGYFSKR